MFDIKNFVSYDQMSDQDLVEKADRHNDSYAQYLWGLRLLQTSIRFSHVTQRDALDYIQLSAVNGCADAQYWLANNHLYVAQSHSLPDLKRQAVTLLESATLKNHFESAVLLGYLHFHDAEMHDTHKATQIWDKALAKEDVNEARKAPFALCKELSNLFSAGAYEYPKVSLLAGSLHILSCNDYPNAVQQRDILDVISEIAVTDPALFERIKKCGLKWPEEERLKDLMEPKETVLDRPTAYARDTSRMYLCSYIHWINTKHTVGTALRAYAQSHLPSAIAHIPSLKLGLEE